VLAPATLLAQLEIGPHIGFYLPAGPLIKDSSLNGLIEKRQEGAILVGAYVDGVMRAAAEVVPDRTARAAMAAITIMRGTVRLTRDRQGNPCAQPTSSSCCIPILWRKAL